MLRLDQIMFEKSLEKLKNNFSQLTYIHNLKVYLQKISKLQNGKKV